MDIMKQPGAADFFESVALIIEQARRFVGRTADLTTCVAYFEVGRKIVEEEQGGKARAEYGAKLLVELSAYLNARFGKGFSTTTLKNARKFYQVYSPSIGQTLFAQFENTGDTRQSMVSILEKKSALSIGQTMFAQSYPFQLSWSHYLILMRIKNEDERRFYEIEAKKQQWSHKSISRSISAHRI